MTPGQRSWLRPLVRAARAGTFLLAHSLIAVLMIGLLTGVAKFLDYMGDHRLFHTVPVSFIIDAMDCAILLVFVTFGVMEAVNVFRESDDEQERTGQISGPAGVEAPTVGTKAEALTGKERSAGDQGAADAGGKRAESSGA